ncbi:hypothetical protein ACH5AL_37705, partial [Actinacidiphila glaucinigra]
MGDIASRAHRLSSSPSHLRAVRASAWVRPAGIRPAAFAPAPLGQARATRRRTPHPEADADPKGGHMSTVEESVEVAV